MEPHNFYFQAFGVFFRINLFLFSLVLIFSLSFPKDSSSQTFTNIASQTGTNDPSDSYGVAWGDFDNDEDLDLYVINTYSANRLFRNDGNEIFSDVAAQMGVDINFGENHATSWADYDSDNDLDLFIGRLEENLFFRNDNNIFTDISITSGLHQRLNTYSGVWADYDNDGDLDLFATSFENSNTLYQNNQGHFINVSETSGIIQTGFSRAAAWGDFDNDGDLDLFVCRGSSNQNQKDFLYRNDNGLFVEVSNSVGITAISYSLGADWGDYDNDGDLDIVVTTSDNQPNILYQNNNGIFTDVSSTVGINNNIGASFSPAWMDYDNDGDLDLFVCRSDGFINLLYDNINGLFTEVQNNAGVGVDLGRSIGLTIGDFNRDGFLDIYVPNRTGENALYRNNGNSNNWVNIRCVGTTFTNVSGIGARVTVISGNLKQMRELNGGSGESSQNSFDAEFGLRSNTTIDSIIVNWPASDTTQIFTEVSSNQFLTIQEPSVPTIVSVIPDVGYQNSNVTTKIMGVNTHFSDGDGTINVWLAQGTDTIYAIDFMDSSNTILFADFNIPTNAPLGVWEFSVLTDADGTITCRNPFEIHPETQFTKITQGAIVNDDGYSEGCGLADYDNDGFIDLLVANWTNQSNLLYKNNGDGIFNKITTGPVVNNAASSYNCSWGDYNNDGYIDLFVANFNSQNNFLYKNNGNGTFTQITTGPVINDIASSRGGSWGDVDNDGYLDLFVANADQSNFLYINNGDGTFTKSTNSPVVNDGGNSVSGSFGDYDNDGYIDLFVTNWLDENNFLYHNNGDGTFSKIISGSIVTDGGSSQGGSWGDFNNDGHLDLLVTNGTGASQNNFLYLNNGDGGSFTKITNGDIVNDGGDSRSGIWEDFDNDGDLDLFIANANQQNNFLYANNGDGTFTKINSGVIVNDGGSSTAAVSGDYDNDGDLDIFVCNINYENNYLYSNNGNNNNWINIICTGTSFTNYSAIGVRLKIKSTINELPTWQIREINAQTGCRSQNSLNVEFGLGDASFIDSLVVEWPASDTAQVFTEVSVNQFLTIQEPIVSVIFSVFPDSGYQGHNVTIDIQGKDTHFADGDGILDVWLNQGSDTIHATSFADSTQTLLKANFDIPLEAQTGSWDLSVKTDVDGKLTWRKPFRILTQPAEISVDPISIEAQVNEGDSLDVVITLFNQGGSDLDWSARIRPANNSSKNANVEPTKQEMPEALNFKRGTDPTSFHRLPKDVKNNEASKGLLFDDISSQDSWAYGVNGFDYQFLRFNLSTPQNTTIISSIGGDFVGGDFDDSGNFYAIDEYTSMLMAVDTLSGTSVTVGPMSNLSGHTWTGLAFDPIPKTMYASSTNGSISTLYTVNTTNGATTIIGSTSNAPIIIDIAIDNGGNMYAHDITSDAIFRIDKTNGTATLIGSTGFDANYAQGMDFDPVTGELYLAAFNNYNYMGELRKVNLNTGLTTLIGPIGNGYDAEVDAFGIAGTSGPSFIRLLPPTSGTIPSNQQTNLFARIYGVTELINDTTYAANIEVISNDPFHASIIIPVEVTVVTDIEEKLPVPTTYAVSQNYPNPFNPETTIKFQLPRISDVKLEIYNILGQMIITLVNYRMAPGYHRVVWDGHNSSGEQVSGGIYIYRFKANNYHIVQKMILLK